MTNKVSSSANTYLLSNVIMGNFPSNHMLKNTFVPLSLILREMLTQASY